MAISNEIKFEAFLSMKFRSNAKYTLGKLVSDIKENSTIPQGTSVIMASGDSQLRPKILDKDVLNKGFSTPLSLNDFATAQGIAPNYLRWFLNLEGTREYLINLAFGAVLLRVPRPVLMDLKIPIPTQDYRNKKLKETILTKQNTSFKNLIIHFYRDYLYNVKNESYNTALILAGATSEVILYQILIEQEVNQKILDDDRTLGLG